MQRLGDVWVSVPDDWVCVERRRWGPFVIAATFQPPDGPPVLWQSRHHRKRRHAIHRAGRSMWWSPRSMGWWIGALFMLGSLCFAVAAVPAYVHAFGARTDNLTYFVGSLVFTSAAALQYLQTVNAPQKIATAGSEQLRRQVRVLAYAPRRIDWWASVVQLAGTIFFNVTTFMALNQALTSTAEINRRVWLPDALGSVCFLIASALAWLEVGHARTPLRSRDSSWWIAFLNLSGSAAFGVSAVASHVVPDSGEVRNAAAVNLGTFVGAVGFFVGALLLLPEAASPVPDLVPDHSRRA
jgi:hypothetical protein